MRLLSFKYFLLLGLFSLGNFASSSNRKSEESEPYSQEIRNQRNLASTMVVSSAVQVSEDILEKYQYVSETGEFRVRCFSSEISIKSLGETILDYVRGAQNQVIVASDQCTNEEFLTDVSNLSLIHI